MLYIGAITAKSNAVATNPYLKLFDNSDSRAQFQISGAGATTVKSDVNGNLTIQSANTWRNVTARGVLNTTVANIGTVDLKFGEEFIWESDELKLG